MTEQLHEITYPTTVRLSRRDIEFRVANPRGYESACVEACRQWLKDNPAPLTYEDRKRLPIGTIIGSDEHATHVKAADGTWHEVTTSGGRSINDATTVYAQPQGVFVPLTDDQIRAVEKWLVVEPNDPDAVNAAGRFVAACREAVE